MTSSPSVCTAETPVGLKFVLANLNAPLPFPDDHFDLIVDKGTTDAIMYGAGDGGVAGVFQQE